MKESNNFTMKAEIFNHRQWIDEVDPVKLKVKFYNLLRDSEFSVLNFQEHYFNPQGWTGLWLLGESHFAIHTFPEEGKSYIELSSCNEEKHLVFIKNI
jgi:S-adenosylmethionine decarboxylase